MHNNLLEEAKREYQQTPVPEYLKYNGWPDLRVKLQDRGYGWKGLVLRRGLAFFGILVFMAASVVAAAQAAKPGEGLYTVKVLADKVYARVTGNYESAIQRRADDVINSAGSQSKGEIESAKKEYEAVLNEAKKEVEDSGKNEDFKKALEDQEQKFKQKLENDPENEEHIKEVIEETERIRGEVKGEKTDESGNDRDHGRSDHQED